MVVNFAGWPVQAPRPISKACTSKSSDHVTGEQTSSQSEKQVEESGSGAHACRLTEGGERASCGLRPVGSARAKLCEMPPVGERVPGNAGEYFTTD
ncbi:hypothetical protein E2C01_051073 [Portunus trituberculatus]|uniref:Uncharacterized protein n=1 Tax=Portunus trituberculatus TaxID=210409 RepID=A0A5B7GHR1_PORTR|nr:hypothetical protein [Portunus trituberculatus]